MKNLEEVLEKTRKEVKVIYVSSYIPRKCGIATYTKDLTNEINKLNPYALSEVMAINRPEQDISYPWEVKFKINQDDLETYLQAANYINQSEADLVMLEHEFGLFGGRGGDYIVPFAETVQKPLLITFHTIIEESQNDFGLVQKRLGERANGMTVMMNESAKKLQEKYGVKKEKVAVIPHGTPDLPYGATDYFKKRKKLTGRIVLGNINLISEAKGIEYSLEAVAKVTKKYPQILYLVIGQTHPVVLKEHGEKYRNKLKAIVRKLRIQKNIKFVNKYLSLSELLEWLQAMDMYVTPYLNPEQSSSGALAYAIGAGKLCISTPYLYAKESLDNDKGILVPFRDSATIAESITEMIENSAKREKVQRKAYDFGRLMTWSNVALQHLELFKTILNQKNGTGSKQ